MACLFNLDSILNTVKKKKTKKQESPSPVMRTQYMQLKNKNVTFFFPL